MGTIAEVAVPPVPAPAVAPVPAPAPPAAPPAAPSADPVRVPDAPPPAVPAPAPAPAAAPAPASAPAPDPDPDPKPKPPEDARIAAIRRQVEYYFSDENLPRDRFLRAKMAENDDGWVDMPVLLSFKKMRALNATVQCLRAALQPSDLVAADTPADRVRRVTPIPDTPDWRSRALYAKGWVATDPEPAPEDVEKMFSPYGKVVAVRIRRWTGEDGERHFKGSVFVEFETAEAVERAAADKHVIKVKAAEGDALEDKELLVFDVDTYFERKREEARERTRKFKERKAAKKAAAQAEKAAAQAKHAVKREFVKGLIMHFSGVGDGVSREDVRELIDPHAEAAWIDFERGASAGHVRFSSADAASTTVAALAGKELGGKQIQLSVLEGDVEAAYWAKVWEQQDNARHGKKRGRDGHDRSGGHKRARGGGRGRGRGFRGRN